MNELMNECLMTSQHEKLIGYWVSEKGNCDKVSQMNFKKNKKFFFCCSKKLTESVIILAGMSSYHHNLHSAGAAANLGMNLMKHFINLNGV